MIPRTGSGRCEVLRDVSTHKLSDHFPVMSWLQTGQQKQTCIYSSHAQTPTHRFFSTNPLPTPSVFSHLPNVFLHRAHTPGRGVLTKWNSGLNSVLPLTCPLTCPRTCPPTMFTTTLQNAMATCSNVGVRPTVCMLIMTKLSVAED